MSEPTSETKGRSNVAEGQSNELSWDAASTGAPDRPTYASTIPEDAYIDRPRRIVAGFVLVILAIVAFVVFAVLAAWRFEEIRDTTIAALPDDLTSDYTDEDLERAVQVLLAAVGVLGLVLALLQLLSANTLMVNRSAAARVTLVVVTVVFLPVAFVALVVAEAGIVDTALVGAAGLCLLTAVALACTPKASRWLRQSAKRRSTPLLASTAAREPRA